MYQRVGMPYYYMLRYATTVHDSIVRRLSELVDSRPSFQFPNQCEAVCELCMLGNISDHCFVIVRSCCVTEKNCWSLHPLKLSTSKLRLSGNSSWATSGNKLRRHRTRVTVHFSILISFELLLSTRAENHWEAVLRRSWALSRCAIRHHQLRLGAAHILHTDSQFYNNNNTSHSKIFQL